MEKSESLTVFINGQVVFEFDKGHELEEQQLAFLDKMDSDMSRGIKIQGELLAKPDNQQRATFISMNLIKAIQQDNDAVIFSSCAYLVNRNPALTEVHANDVENSIKIEFVE